MTDIVYQADIFSESGSDKQAPFVGAWLFRHAPNQAPRFPHQDSHSLDYIIVTLLQEHIQPPYPMPYRSEKIPIAGTDFDRRQKLMPEAHDLIKKLKAEGWSFRKLAKMFNVSKWTIQNIINPPKRVPSSSNKTTEEQSAIKKEYRRRKELLFKAGYIKLKKK